MDILDLVALMKKYAEENSEILEFAIRKVKTAYDTEQMLYLLKAKGEHLDKYYFQLTSSRR